MQITRIKGAYLLVLGTILAGALYMVLAHARPALAAAGCSALSASKGAVVISNVNVPATGTYHVWSRIKVADTTNNSYYFQTDNNCLITIGDNASITPGSWVWVDYKDGATGTKANVTLTAGVHPLELAGRENDVLVDKVMLLSDSCTPTGTGTNCQGVTGDLDDSNEVDQDDLNLFKADYGKLTQDATTPEADLNNDSKINVVDLSVLLRNWTN